MEKQHFIYKITNKINGRFYIGMHTGLPDDGYFGSGKRIKAEIKKYGRENFIKEILEVCSSRETLILREKEIVNDDLLNNHHCLNLKNGGEGGWNLTEEMITKRKITFSKRMNGRKHSESHANAISLSKMGNENFRDSTRFAGKRCSAEHKAKIGEKNKSMIGEKNSQFGTCWVTNGTPIKIKKEKLDDYLLNGYRRGRK